MPPGEGGSEPDGIDINGADRPRGRDMPPNRVTTSGLRTPLFEVASVLQLVLLTGFSRIAFYQGIFR
ncbi:hypothetical protein, partial [Nocardia fluminea]|uniref:hypothetical protein n=1 Tax=Nocardia fluminea TaxID=134984 RepID=UPI0033DF930E